jgi:ubiquinone/menaquinone biosynthesis C-methylase UbiE
MNAMNNQARGTMELRTLQQDGGTSAGRQPGKKYRAAKFWDWIANRYARTPVSDELSYQRKLQTTQEYLRPDMEVLEFGCGTGSTALVLAPYVKHIRAIDISSRMIEIAQAKAEASGAGNVTFEQLNLGDLRALDQSYGAVLGLNVLHLLGNWEAVISEAYRLLVPGGVLVTSTACLGDSMKWAKFVAPVTMLSGCLPQVKVFSSRQLINSLTGAGFEIEHKWQPADKYKAVFIIARKPA